MSISLESLNVKRDKEIITIASKNVAFCKENDTISEVVDKIVSTEHRRIPVVSKRGDVVGVLTKSDILDAFLRAEDFGQNVSTIMNRELILCDAHDSIGHTLQKFKISRRGGFPVVERNKLVGMISERDFVSLVSGNNTGIKVKDVMTKKPFVLQPNISIHDCLKTMVNTHYRRLPVVESVANRKLIGIVTSTDLLKYIHDNNYDLGALDEPLDKIIIKNAHITGPEEDLSQAAKAMTSHDVGGLLVVDNTHSLEGIATERDILEEIF
jgi:CBS domain-containing protein